MEAYGRRWKLMKAYGSLWQLGIFFKVGLALLKERATTLLRLIKHVIEHGGIAS